MKKYFIEITFDRESYNGFDYEEHRNWNVEARNEKSAENKATKKFHKDYKGFCVKRCIIKEIQDENVSDNNKGYPK